MTIEEVRALAVQLRNLSTQVTNASMGLDNFLMQVIVKTNPETNPFFDFDFPNQTAVDNFVTAQTPIYAQHLTNIEVAADALGTDPFNP